MTAPALLAWLIQQPGRCRECGFHIAEQGHGRSCSVRHLNAERAARRQGRKRSRGEVDLYVLWAVTMSIALLAFAAAPGPVSVVADGALHLLAIWWWRLLIAASIVVGVAFWLVVAAGARLDRA